MIDSRLEAFFAELDVPTLRLTLAAGRVMDVVSPDDVDAYCRVAAVRWSGHPQRSPEGEELVPNLVNLFVRNISYAVSYESETIAEDDESVTVVTPDGPLLVTVGRMRHWEWMLALLTDEKVAATFLAQAPESARRQAEERVVAAFAEDLTDLAVLVGLDGLDESGDDER